MPRIVVPRPWTEQPQHAVEIASRFAHPDTRAFIGSTRQLIGADYAQSGTIATDATPVGVSALSSTTASYINAGRVMHAQPGRLVTVAQFIATDAVMRYVHGNVSTNVNYIDDLRINSTQSETTGAGRVAYQLRSQAATGLQLHAATTAAVHGVGDVCTMVWSLDSATTLSCAVNGSIRPITYSASGPYTAPETLSEFPMDLLNRNVRAAHSAGTGVRLLLWARLPIAGLDIEALSADPWQIFEPEEFPVWFSVAGGTSLVVADVARGHTLDTTSLTQTHNLVQADVNHAHTVDAITLTQTHNLAQADVLHAHTLDNVVLNVDATLALANVDHGHTVEAVTLTQAHNLALADVTHAHLVDVVALTQAHNLAQADVNHAHTVEPVTLVVGGVNLSLDIVLHAHTLDNVNLTQAHSLSLVNIAHGHTLDNVIFTFDGVQLSAPRQMYNNSQTSSRSNIQTARRP